MDESSFRQLWRSFATLIREHKDELNELDAAIGDADHGSNMDRGLTKVVDALEASPEGSLRADAKLVGMTLMGTVGGASGALWGSAMLKFAAALPDAPTVSWADFVAALDAFVQALAQRGKATVGDKTMMDVFIPMVDELQTALTAGEPPFDTVRSHAREYSERTYDMVAKRGRAAYLGERSVGHVDPGSRSSALWFEALGAVGP
ncbi:MAG: dihydroxyacetone kinase subunit DhaL [Ferrimicrobium sp.]|uniref:Dihydroxyacetone kinase subunit DhaL n=1 Tax=Ferrimicrobium acidiphilum TaxID=121039 RepID=A0ABV3Y545_9ACTN|nr:dihydroxyacetone kinase subunit DhaL [Ferrimicrobium sp.]MCL5973378.1 dihydroxyacetone kinase subunit DhaL [Actinomycetota bacterium]